MNQIQRIRLDLAKRFEDIKATLDEPAKPTGPWFLDIQRAEGGPIVVEWRSDRGFGVSTPDGDDFGMGPDGVYPNAQAAFDRVKRLILSGSKTELPEAVRLADLRKLRRLSQEGLATLVNVGQANISRIESRGDLLVSTLVSIVNAMGGTLSMVVRFPDGMERELKF